MQQETYSRNHARWARVLGVMSADPDSEQHAVLEGLFEAHFGALLAYARRGTAQLSDAEDVVAETFTVAWRRMGDLPANEAPGEHGHASDWIVLPPEHP